MSRRAYGYGEVVPIGEMPVCLYGHLAPEEYHSHGVDQGCWDAEEPVPSVVRHVWYRWVPAQPGDDYSMWGFEAKSASRGAFPLTYAELPA